MTFRSQSPWIPSHVVSFAATKEIVSGPVYELYAMVIDQVCCVGIGWNESSRIVIEDK